MMHIIHVHRYLVRIDCMETMLHSYTVPNKVQCCATVLGRIDALLDGEKPMLTCIGLVYSAPSCANDDSPRHYATHLHFFAGIGFRFPVCVVST